MRVNNGDAIPNGFFFFLFKYLVCPRKKKEKRQLKLSAHAPGLFLHCHKLCIFLQGRRDSDVSSIILAMNTWLANTAYFKTRETFPHTSQQQSQNTNCDQPLNFGQKSAHVCVYSQSESFTEN